MSFAPHFSLLTPEKHARSVYTDNGCVLVFGRSIRRKFTGETKRCNALTRQTLQSLIPSSDDASMNSTAPQSVVLPYPTFTLNVCALHKAAIKRCRSNE